MRRRTGVWAAGTAALALGAAALLVAGLREEEPAAAEGVEGVERVDVAGAGDHTTESVAYRNHPPAGGPHHPIWQNCGFYAEPVQDEHAVHSLEHGAVWIAYEPGLDEAALEPVREAVRDRRYTLASPYPGVEGLTLVAWGYRLELAGADDERLDAFLTAFAGGTDVPEPGGPCHGGVGTPV
ncbi:DUF3105 domain-containing protein [Glycomyces sp. A-F 0318]|uniref:DUF3105 domain-containing protein n=1 Tax=Glycomyces amatae TaxID=2881355 RepID=UPI001E34F5A9|nr:DUF3105 domain-containing protein [Glycomyces amatae]